MADETMTADQVHAQVHDLRARAAQPPERIELGKQQRAAIEAANHAAAGSDSGPLLEFQGLQVIKSRRDDHVRLLATGEQGEDVEVETIEPIAPSGPDAPAVTQETQPSGS